MSPTIEEQIEWLKSTIAEMEAQRDALGDTVLQKAVDPLREKLEQLTQQLEVSQASIPDKPTQLRKLVTLLFMDIAGSTSIAQHMDPEDVSEIFDLTLKKLSEPVERYGGRVTRFMGDGFLSVFGAPTAREDDPEQAVRTGLAIIDMAGEIAEELEKERDIKDFQIRVGVNTGLVMLGGETEAENTLMGAAVNLAARLESAAPPGGLLISHDTYRHIRGVFDVEAWEPIRAKGFDQPMQVYRVIRARPRAFRVHTRGVEGVETRMVGRETELKHLQDALLTAIEEGEGQLVTIVGDAGVGKSRLLYEFREWIELLPPPAVTFFEGRAQLESQGIPYAQLRDLFAFRFQIQDNDHAETARERIEDGLAEAFGREPDGETRIHVLGHWLGFDFSASPRLKGLLNDPGQLRNRSLIYLDEYFKKLSSSSPVVVFLEDIHWADDSSLEVLNWLGERMHHQRLLVVCTTRHSFFERRPYWGEGVSFHRRINMEPLTRRESRQLVAEILRLVPEIPPELRELVVEGAEGNPFYVEELIKMLIENGVVVKSEETWHIEPERLAHVEVPPTLAGVLQARLDILPIEERTILQQASIVGRTFWDRTVTYVHSGGIGRADIVPAALTALRSKELIYRREESAFADAHEYIFKHDILREVTYESVLKRQRRVYHGLVADWLITYEADRAGEYDGLIAEHLLRAGRQEQASHHFNRAGEAALASYANREAEVHFRKALDLSPGVFLRVACLAGLGEALGRQGKRNEADQTLRQAIDLYYEMGKHDKVAHLYTRLSQVLWHDDYQKAWEACREGLMRLSGAADSPDLANMLAEAGRTSWFVEKSSEKVFSLCSQTITMAERLGIVEAQVDASITLAIIKGDIQQSIEILHEVIALSEAHGLLRTAFRAHFNVGHQYLISMIGAMQSFQHFVKAAEISRQMGSIDEMIIALENAFEPMISIGHLETVESFIADFLQQSSATDAQVKESLQVTHTYVLHNRGEWMQSLEHIRAESHKLQKGGNLQLIASLNILLAATILELNQFAAQDHLEEAEAALHKNIAMQWFHHEAHLLLSIIAARSGRIQEAYDRLNEFEQSSGSTRTGWQESFRLRAELELAFVERRWDNAVATCQVLIDIFQTGGFRWEWARQLIDLGDSYHHRDGPGDYVRARDAFSQALEMFTEMGALGYIQVLEERLRE